MSYHSQSSHSSCIDSGLNSDVCDIVERLAYSQNTNKSNYDTFLHLLVPFLEPPSAVMYARPKFTGLWALVCSSGGRLNNASEGYVWCEGIVVDSSCLCSSDTLVLPLVDKKIEFDSADSHPHPKRKPRPTTHPTHCCSEPVDFVISFSEPLFWVCYIRILGTKRLMWGDSFNPLSSEKLVEKYSITRLHNHVKMINHCTSDWNICKLQKWQRNNNRLLICHNAMKQWNELFGNRR